MNKKYLLNAAGWLLALVILGLFGRQIARQGDAVREMLLTLNWIYFGLALLVLLVAQSLRTQTVTIVHYFLQHPISPGHGFRIWTLSQMAKYLPGGIWLFPTRIGLYMRNGFPALVASAAMLWELFPDLVIGLILSLGSITILHNPSWTLLVIVGTLSLTLVVLLSSIPQTWHVARRLGLRRADQMIDLLHSLGDQRGRLFLVLCAWSLLVWVLVGMGFYLMLLAFDPTGRVSVWEALVAYAMAWTIGFLVFFTPVGLGPREAVLVLFLAPVFGEETAMLIALLARLWWTLAEGVMILASLAWNAVYTGSLIPNSTQR